MKVTKQIEVFDTNVIRKGDIVKIKDLKTGIVNNRKVHDVNCNVLSVETECGKTLYYIDEIKDYEIKKVKESKLSKFKIGERYKVEDKLSGDTYNAEVIAVDKEMVLRRDSGKYTIVQESQIDNVLMFYTIDGIVTNKEIEDFKSKYKFQEDNLKEQQKQDEEFKKWLNDEYTNAVKVVSDLLSQCPNIKIKRY